VLAFFWRSLPEPLLSFGAFEQLPRVCAKNDPVAVTQWVTVNMRAESKALLRYTFAFLRLLENACGALTLDVLSDLFAPALLRPPSLTEATVTSMLQQSVCLKFLLQNARSIFGDANLDNLAAEVQELTQSGVVLVESKSPRGQLKKKALPQEPVEDDEVVENTNVNMAPKRAPPPTALPQVSRASLMIKIDVEAFHSSMYGSQIEFQDTPLIVGGSCFAQFNDDMMWYPATIKHLLPNGGAHVVFDNYGNGQDSRADQIAVDDAQSAKDAQDVHDLGMNNKHHLILLLNHFLQTI
jgi:hypothetical protein